MNCAEVRDRTPELALGILEGEERAEVIAHLDECSGCQMLVDEYATIADLLPQLAPEAEPSSSFERHTLAAMSAPRWRAARKWVAVIAATAAAAAVISVTTVRLIDADRDRTPVATALRSVAMTTPDGTKVGRVTTTTGNPTAVYVTVEYLVADGAYVLQLRGSGEPVGTLRVQEGHGEWNGMAKLAEPGPSTLQMVDGAGNVVCQAQLD